MKRYCLSILLLGLVAVLTANAQVPSEHMRIYTDKEFYLAGEEMWIKVCVTDSLYRPYSLSKVAYVEVSDTKQIYAQAKVKLTDGVGWAAVKLNSAMHSGSYRLMAYTRYMRNNSLAHFPKKYIAVLNPVQMSDDDAIALQISDVSLPAVEENPFGRISTDKQVYKHRERVNVTLPELPAGCTELSLSVVRNDYQLSPLPAVDETAEGEDPLAGKRFVAECEGHIAQGRLVEGTADSVLTRLSCVGKDVRVFDGRPQPDGTFLFFTTGVTDMQDVVLTALPFPESVCRPELISPFIEALPKRLPEVTLTCKEQELLERAQGVQMHMLLPAEVDNGQGGLLKQLHGFKPQASYNLDEYVRFNTVRDVLIEFVVGVTVYKAEIRAKHADTNRFSRSKTLVLLDGVPIEDHEKVLDYNANLLHYIHRYGGQYTFGGKIYDGIVSLITHKGGLPEMLLDVNSQLLAYEFPQYRPLFRSPLYDTYEQRTSRLPDYRHTLCWLPELNASERTFSFYTSDLGGTYEIVLRGITATGEPMEVKGRFQVGE